MATKKPLCDYSGKIRELQTGDSLPGRREITYSISGTLATGTGSLRRYIQADFTISKIVAAVGSAPSGSSIAFDVRKSGGAHSIMSTDGLIAAGSNMATVTSFSNATVEAGSYLTVDINAVGSGSPGSDLTITICE